MRTGYDLLFFGLLIAGVACARISDGAPAASETATRAPPVATTPESSEVRADLGKLFGSLRSLADASPEAISRTLGRKFPPHSDIRNAARWSGPSQCGIRFIDVVPSASGGGVSIALDTPARAGDGDTGACCSLRLRDLADDLEGLGYGARVSDIQDRRKTWFFEPVQPKAGFAIQAQAWTDPASASSADRDVCVTRVDIRTGPGI